MSLPGDVEKALRYCSPHTRAKVVSEPRYPAERLILAIGETTAVRCGVADWIEGPIANSHGMWSEPTELCHRVVAAIREEEA